MEPVTRAELVADATAYSAVVTCRHCGARFAAATRAQALTLGRQHLDAIHRARVL